MNKLHKEILKPESFDLLNKIAVDTDFDKFFLAGGTSLALQIGHRISDDLDFFTNKEFKSNLISKFKHPYEIITLNDNSIELVSQNTKVMFFYFAFPLYEKLLKIEGVNLLSPVDVGLFKLLALQGRSTRKDIIDLYFIDKEIMTLEELLKIFESHFPKESFNAYSSIKKLFNLEELEMQPMPKMMKETNWEEISTKVTKELSAFIKKSTKK